MGIFRKKYVGAVLYAILLTSFTLYVVLDTFVITRVYSEVSSEENDSIQYSSGTEPLENTENEDTTNTDNEDTERTSETVTEQEGTSQFSETAVYTESSYSDPNINIEIKEYQESNTTIYVADVSVSSIEYLQTAFAENSFGQNITEKTSKIAEANNAILAINGDYYGAQRTGYVLKNGVLYRESAASEQTDLVIWADGSFEIIAEQDSSASNLLANGALQILSFGPALIEGGTISVSQNEEVGKAKASNPRTAIGIVDDLHYLFIVSDGRTRESEGLSLYQLAEFMQSLGADIAYNLDGGGSSTMVFNGNVINNPTTSGKSIKERSVSDIVYIGY